MHFPEAAGLSEQRWSRPPGPAPNKEQALAPLPALADLRLFPAMLPDAHRKILPTHLSVEGQGHKRRHPNKSAKWRATTYWHPEQGKWQFATKDCSLRLHRMTPIKRHVKVQGTKSPFDGNWIYWTKRQGNHPETPPKMAYLLKRQQESV
jgi:hypothetical protein